MRRNEYLWSKGLKNLWIACKGALAITIVLKTALNSICNHNQSQFQYFIAGGPTEEDELYETHITETNMIYKLDHNKLVAVEEYWGAQPKYEMLNPYQVSQLWWFVLCT